MLGAVLAGCAGDTDARDSHVDSVAQTGCAVDAIVFHEGLLPGATDRAEISCTTPTGVAAQRGRIDCAFYPDQTTSWVSINPDDNVRATDSRHLASTREELRWISPGCPFGGRGVTLEFRDTAGAQASTSGADSSTAPSGTAEK
ncbi:hypothetical protein C1Y63_09775 [Corynebacterium sp. 13CS0277]|nr:hypothetical protein C1Y63_09775 [Corynebacterium sp. 13CS0277]